MSSNATTNLTLNCQHPTVGKGATESVCGVYSNGKLIALGSPKQLMNKFEVKNLEYVFIKLTGRKIREEV